MQQKISLELNHKTLTLEVGRLAKLANAAVVAQYGETVVLATVVMAGTKPELDYFPLSVEYQEKLYAGGRIKGSRWVKREGKPSDEAVLTARLIDRSIRPLFPQEMMNEVQVIVTVLSVDSENDADMPAIVATSAALAVSDIPWEGPVGAVRLGLNKQKFISKKQTSFIINPSYTEREESQLDLVVASTNEATMMVEAGAKEVDEATMLKAFAKAQEENAKIAAAISKLAEAVGQKKMSLSPIQANTKLKQKLDQEGAVIDKLIEAESSLDRAMRQELMASVIEKYPDDDAKTVVAQMNELIKAKARAKILKTGKRPDGRKPEDIRPISCEVGVLPRTHGSAIFQRGDTQALTITTLGSPALEMLIESMEFGEESKRYMHHYYMPPYTVGEVGRLGWPSRREVGHGALAERALEPVIPTEDEFPYTIRVVSEIMASNGSTSMASVCGSTLSLMDAGVPITKPVAGIAMGLVTDDKKTVVLSDIQGMEDHLGDMDFKVAGTKEGITAMQMDVKVKGIDETILKAAIEQARQGRLMILEKMLKVMPAARAHISPYAPKISVLKIPEDKIGELIGPGGRVIKKLIADTGTEINVEDDGQVTVSGMDRDKIKQAVDWIKGLTREVVVGEELEGTVKRIQPFGAFVEVLPGKEGLVHVSRMAAGFVDDPNQIVTMGQSVKVKVTKIDELGRIDLAMLDEAGNPYGPPPGSQSGRPGGGFRRGGFRSPRRDGGGFRPRREFHDRRRG